MQTRNQEKKKENIFFFAIFESRIHPRRGISGHTLHKIRSLIVARCFYLSTARSTYSVQVTMSRNGSCIALPTGKKELQSETTYFSQPVVERSLLNEFVAPLCVQLARQKDPDRLNKFVLRVVILSCFLFFLSFFSFFVERNTVQERLKRKFVSI